MPKFTRRSAFKTLGAGALAAATASAFAEGQAKVKWRMQALWDGGTTPQKFEEQFVKRIAEITDGGFQIELFSAGQIVPANQAFDAVRGGAFQLMKTFDGYEAGKIPSFAFTSTIPFGFTQPDQYEAWFYELGGLDLARKAYAPAGLFYIAPTVYGPEPIHSKTPLRKVADFKGKKGRFVGLASAVMASLGVDVTPLATADVYSALDKGVIDIADRGDLMANYEAGLGEVASYILMPGPHQPTTATSYVANKAAYDKLPQAYKAALMVAAKEVSLDLREHMLVTDGTATQKFKAQGVEFTSLEPDDVQQAREKVVDVWRTATKNDALAKQILDSQIAFMQQLKLIA